MRQNLRIKFLYVYIFFAFLLIPNVTSKIKKNHIVISLYYFITLFLYDFWYLITFSSHILLPMLPIHDINIIIMLQ